MTNLRLHAIIVKYLWIITLLFVPVFLIFGVCSDSPLKVSRVMDRDTITGRDGRVEKTIRPVGIDAPEVFHKKREPSQPYGETASPKSVPTCAPIGNPGCWRSQSSESRFT